jgi:protein-S-isoprenylcysteine O-methyltransferase Ste14
MEPKRDHASVVVNPIVVYIGLAGVAILLQVVLPLSFMPVILARILGVILIVLNFVFGIPAIRGMLQAKTSPNPQRPSTTLILSGVYQRTRNPMYVGLTMVFAGALILNQNMWGLLFVPLLVWLITIWVIIPEETYLEEKFGLEYAKYKSSVRRWI